MKHMMRMCVAVAVVALATTVRAQQDDAAAVAKLTAEYQAAYSSHNAKAAAALYATDGDRRTPDGKVVKGRAAIERQLTEDFAGRFKSAIVKFDSAEDIRHLDANTMLVDGSAQLSGVEGAAGATRYLHTLVLVKRGGTWQILALRNWPAR